MDGFIFYKIKKRRRLAHYCLFFVTMSVNLPAICRAQAPVIISLTNSNSVHVGAADFLLVSGLNVGDIAAYSWSSGNPSVAAVSDAQALEARINGLMPGIAEVFYSVTLTDGMEGEASFVVAVTPALRLSAQTDTSDIRCGDLFSLDIVASDYFDHLLALQFSVHWNPAVLQALSVSAAPIGLAPPVTFFEQTAGYAAFAWSDVASVYGVDAPDGTVLMTLHFRVKGNVSATAVSISDWPAPLEATNAAAVAFEPDTPAPLEVALIPLKIQEIPDQLVCPQGNLPPLLLQALPADDPTIQYAWSGGAAAGLADGSSTGSNPFIPAFTAGSIPGVYPVTLSAERQGCADSLGFSVYVLDTVAPQAQCKSVSATLDKFGVATVTPSAVNNHSMDDCATNTSLNYALSPGAFNCSNFGVHVATLTVTDLAGNSATCTAIVTIQEGEGACTPIFSVQTACLNNSTIFDNGQFTDRIQVQALAGQTWTVTDNSNFFASNSPPPPAAPTALPPGTILTNGASDGLDNNGNGQTDEVEEMVYYTLHGTHIQGLGYSMTVNNNVGQSGTILNKVFYPTPIFTNLAGPFCLSTPPFQIGVEDQYGAQGIVNGITVNGAATSIFDPAALGVGFHLVRANFDAGPATQNLVINGAQMGGSIDDARLDPGCQQPISAIIQVLATPTTVACNDTVRLSLDADCEAIITPDMILEGSYDCYDDYRVALIYPAGTDVFSPPNTVNASHLGKTVMARLIHTISGNLCMTAVKVEDKLNPALHCPADRTVACSESTEPAYTGTVSIADCAATTTEISQQILDNGACGNPRQLIERVFRVTDAWGNQSECSQMITVLPLVLSDAVFPPDITVHCAAAYLHPTAPAVTGAPTLNGASLAEYPICNAKASYTDTYFAGCAGAFTILRNWGVLRDCLPLGPNNPILHIQRIVVEDETGPQFNCPGDVTVSTDAFDCCATAALPSAIVTEDCSAISQLEAMVTSLDSSTGNSAHFMISGQLSDFPGNNYWTPDTLAVFPNAHCLPLGIYSVEYRAADACGNSSTCAFEITIADLTPPLVVCAESFQEILSGNGEVIVYATTIDAGSSDNCTPADLLDYAIVESDESTGVFPTDAQGNPLPSVTFDCLEVGTQTVQLWRRDAAGNADYCETYVIVQDPNFFCSPGTNATVAGILATEVNEGVEASSVQLAGTHPALPPASLFDLSNNQGVYAFPNAVPFGMNYTVTPLKDDNPLNGVTTYDLALISKHILGLEALDSPYKMIAADANKSNSITTFDILELRKLILGVYTELPNNTSWRFVDKDWNFTDAANPFVDQIPEFKSVADIQASQIADDFVGVKVGDVNGSAIANALMQVDDRTSSTLLFDVNLTPRPSPDGEGSGDRTVRAGETFAVTFTASEQVIGYQYTLNLKGLEVLDIEPGEGMKAGNFAVFADAITTSFDVPAGTVAAPKFTVFFRAETDGRLSKLLGVSSRITKAEAYKNGQRLDVALRFNGTTVSGVGFELYQNTPNPWINRTQIGFHLPEAAEATLTVYDETGRLLYTQTGDFAKGYNAFAVDRAQVSGSGALFYKVATGTDSEIKTMIQTE